MKKLIFIINENWKDPVWSKVIATVIISLSTFILASLYALFEYLFSKISFWETFQKINEWLNNEITFSLRTLIILILLYLVLASKQIVKLIREIESNKKTTLKKEVKRQELKLPIATEHSTSFFHQRMASSFPGVRDITWFNDSKVAVQRLEILLKEPISFSAGSHDCESDPIWWFRGRRALFIYKFLKIGRKKVLMNNEQLIIKRIAVYHGDTYYKDFVYVEVEGEKQTGLYEIKANDVQSHIDKFGYSWEEYGLIKNWLGWKIPIKREDFEDGATVIRGNVKDTQNAESRVRYISKYNFIIAAKGSPYNSNKFNCESKVYLDGILKGQVEPDDFFNFLKGFHKYE